jgi:hypothetical protein
MTSQISLLGPPLGPTSIQGDAGPTARPNSQKLMWRRFEKQRRAQLHDEYPCAMPTFRLICPTHRTRVGPTTGLCKPCRDELYEQLAAEYLDQPKGAAK